MNEHVQMQGDFEPSLAPVVEAFCEGFTAGREVGAALAIWLDGERVADVRAGHVDRRKTQLWAAETLACCFSVSKAITATCVLQAVAQGAIKLDVPVADYWPEFAAADKGAVTVEHLLTHQAGLPAFHEPVDKALLYDWDAVCVALAAEAPWWTPGTTHGYHARTFGFLLGEVLRRATGQTVRQWLQMHITGPRQLDVHLGLDDEHHHRCATMLPAKVRLGEDKNWPPAMQRMMTDFNNPATVTGATFQNPSLGAGYMNSVEFRRAEMPAISGHATARDLARLFAEIPRLLPADLLQRALVTYSHGPDEVLKSTTRFGLGYMLHDPDSPIGWPGCFGHAGAGGSVAFCDPERRLGFAFIMNQMQEGVVSGGTTAQACTVALQDVLGEL